MTAFGLLLLVTIPLLFSVAALLKQKLIQYQRRERLETELLETITVSPKNIYWISPGKEAMIDGELFDVESMRSEGGKMYFTGIFDSKEDKLLKEMKDLSDQKTEQNSPANQLAIKFLLATVYSDPVPFTFQNPWYITTRQFLIYTETILKGYGSSAIHPPNYS